jgi:hypothetical protein
MEIPGEPAVERIPKEDESVFQVNPVQIQIQGIFRLENGRELEEGGRDGENSDLDLKKEVRRSGGGGRVRKAYNVSK